MTRGATFAIDDAIFSTISPDLPDANSRRDYVIWVWVQMRHYFQILSMRDFEPGQNGLKNFDLFSFLKLKRIDSKFFISISHIFA